MGRIVYKLKQARLNYQARLGRAVTLEEVASSVGISRGHLSNLELGRTWPSKQVLEGLCNFYGVPLEELLAYEEEGEENDRLALRLAAA